MNWIEITLAVIGGANFVMQLSIKNQMLQMKIELVEKFLSKDDFDRWTKRSSYLPSFKEHSNARN